MLVCALQATLSNCGNTLKTSTPSDRGKPWRGRANSPGYGNSLRYDTFSRVEMGNPQPSPKALVSRAPWMLFTGQMVAGGRLRAPAQDMVGHAQKCACESQSYAGAGIGLGSNYDIFR